MSQESHLLPEEPAVDLAVAAAMAAELETYLVQDDLYRTLIVRTPAGDLRSQMTAGDLLARLYRLQGERGRLSPAQQAALDVVQRQTRETTRSLWTRFTQRLHREVRTRLSSLRWYLDECRQDSARCRRDYPYEIRNRQRIELLVQALDGELPAELADQLRAVDERIQSITAATGFIWPESFAALYSRNTFWYLYVLPRE